MTDRESSTVERSSRRWMVYAVAAVAVVAVLGWLIGPRRSERVTTVDGQSQWQPSEAPPQRRIVWQTATSVRPLAEKLRGGESHIRPQITEDGTALYFTLRTIDDDSDIYMTQRVDGQWQAAKPVNVLNSAANEIGPVIHAGGKQLFFYSDREGGYGGTDLYVAYRELDGSWSRPENLGPRINSPAHEYDPAISPDGKSLFFSSNRSEKMQQALAAGALSDGKNAWKTTLRADLGRRRFDLFQATWNDKENRWNAASDIASLNKTNFDEGAPYISPDGAFLYFVSNRPERPGEAENFDIYRARLIDGRPERMENLGRGVNTTANEIEPSLSNGGFRIVFSRNVDDAAGAGATPTTHAQYGLFESTAQEVEIAAAWDFSRWHAFTAACGRFGRSITNNWWWIVAALLALALLAAFIWYLRQVTLKRFAVPGFLLTALLLHLLLGVTSFFVYFGEQVVEQIKKVVEETVVATDVTLDANQSHKPADEPYEKIADLEAPDTIQPEEVPRQITELPNVPVPTDSVIAKLPTKITQDMSVDLPSATVPTPAPQTNQPPPKPTLDRRQVDPIAIAAAVPLLDTEPAETREQQTTPDTVAVDVNRQQPTPPTPTAAPQATPTLRPQPVAAPSLQLEPIAVARATPAPLSESSQPSPKLPVRVAATSPTLAPPAAVTPVEVVPTETAEASPSSAESSVVVAVAKVSPAPRAEPTLQDPSPTLQPSPTRMTVETPAAQAAPSQRSAPPSLTEFMPAKLGRSSQSVARNVVVEVTAVPTATVPNQSSPSTSAMPQPNHIPLQVSRAAVESSTSEPTFNAVSDPFAGALANAIRKQPTIEQSRAVQSASDAVPSRQPSSLLLARASTALPTVEFVPAAVETTGSFAADANSDESPATTSNAKPLAVSIAKATIAGVPETTTKIPAANVTAVRPAVGQMTAAETILLATSSATQDVPSLAKIDAPLDRRNTSVAAVNDIAIVPMVEVSSATANESTTESPSDGAVEGVVVDVQRAAVGANSVDVNMVTEIGGRHSDLNPRLVLGSFDRQFVNTALSTSPIASRLPRRPALGMESALALDRVNLQSLLERRKVDPQKKLELVEKYGGTEETLAAIERGLQWLKQHQHSSGMWSLHEFHNREKGKKYSGTGSSKSDSAATGLSLLAFLGDGHTHKVGDYKDSISRAVKWLTSHQKENGDLFTGGEKNAHMYSHGIATIALCECFGLSQDEALREPAQRAIDFIVAAQDKKRGGWRYGPGDDSDTSVVGWQVMALESGQMAGLAVPQKTLDGARRWLESVGGKGSQRGQFAYQGNRYSNTMSAEGLLCMIYLGAERDAPFIRSGSDRLLKALPARGKESSYYMYYATQTMFHLQGEHWRRWNEKLQPLLLETQHVEGHLSGTWDPKDQWESVGGRLYASTLRLLMLEASYRHLPLYQMAQ